MTVPGDRETAGEAGSGPDLDRSVMRLLADLAAETSLLLRQEVTLFRVELAGNLARLGRGAFAVAAGAVIAFAGWGALLAAAILGLSTLLRPWLAALVVAVANLAAGAGLLYFGRTRLAGRSLAPRRTVRSLRADASWLKERLR